MADETLLAQKVLSCIFRLKQQFGVKHVIDVLRGAKTKAILERRHEELSTYNLTPELSEADLRSLIDHLIEDGVLKRTEGDYPVVQWTPLSQRVIQGEYKVQVRKKISKVIASKPKKELTYDEALFQKLSALRKSLAQEQQVPAFVIFGDRTLIEMCQVRPTSCQQMLAINGMGPIKWQKYGAIFLDAITTYLAGFRGPA
jgi:ATP-dependent DNA helicase RecQ